MTYLAFRFPEPVLKRARFVDRQSPEPEWKALHRVADRNIGALSRPFVAAVEALRESVSVVQLEDELRRGPELAVSVPDWDAFRLRLERVWVPALLTTLQAGMRVSRPFTEKQLGIILKQVETVGRLDLSSPEAIAWANANAAELVREVTTESMLAFREIIVRAQREGLDVRQQARLIREAGLGLTQRQALAVANFATGLREQELAEAVITRRVERFYDRAIRRRARLIARTETIRASNMGQQEVWRQAAEQGFLDPNRSRRVWIVTPDDDLCVYCRSIGKQFGPGTQGVGLEQQFMPSPVQLQNGGVRTMPPTLTPPLHPQCRCALGFETTL